MPKANNTVALVQQQILDMCDTTNVDVPLSSSFLECMTNFEESLDPELAAEGLFGELRLTRQEGVNLDGGLSLGIGRSPRASLVRTNN